MTFAFGMKTAQQVVRNLLISIAVPGLMCVPVLFELQDDFSSDRDRSMFVLFMMATGPIAYGFLELRQTLRRVRQSRLSTGHSDVAVRMAELALCAVVLPAFVGAICWLFIPIFDAGRK